MSRNVLVLAATALAISVAGPVLAADWGIKGYEPVFKPSYPMDYVQPDPLGFEAGMRYWYGMGGHNFATGGNTYTLNDANHMLEAHLRIDDHSTSTYLKGNAGFAAIIDGEYTTPLSGGATATNEGSVSYAGADFGYTPIDSGGFRAGGFIGYQYLNESTHMGRTNYRNAGGGFNSEVNALNIHALRLGVTARAEFNSVMDIQSTPPPFPTRPLRAPMARSTGRRSPRVGQIGSRVARARSRATSMAARSMRWSVSVRPRTLQCAAACAHII